ncbi:MAG: class II aldolase/adducin family protein [Spirochaetaceae bacterium]|jgi:rhamnose utilization protein RhaD (predicted bifunctional aldolase and dehydrogenase)|nr:class II aldolase/adducin family protein [Spirochaetaceae bacterium]
MTNIKEAPLGDANIETLTAISRRYGLDPDYVIAGGGNTSFKDADTLYVKGSGIALAESKPENFVKMDRRALRAIRTKTYPPDPDLREQAVLADLMSARRAGEEQKRPSVETLLHDGIPFPWVIHTHPALVNGLACSQQGEAKAKELFPEAIWIPSTNPGYILSKKVWQAMDAYQAQYGKPVSVIFLQNHGVFVSADTPEGIDEQYRYLMGKLSAAVRRQPDLSGRVSVSDRTAEVAAVAGNVAFLRNQEIASFVSDAAAFAPLASAFTPDHIVYAGSNPLFVKTGESVKKQWDAHIAKTGRKPKIIAVQGNGVFGAGDSEKAANLATALFLDAVKVAVYAESFGGCKAMPQDQIGFINNWEVERYRSKVSA